MEEIWGQSSPDDPPGRTDSTETFLRTAESSSCHAVRRTLIRSRIEAEIPPDDVIPTASASRFAALSRVVDIVMKQRVSVP